MHLCFDGVFFTLVVWASCPTGKEELTLTGTDFIGLLLPKWCNQNKTADLSLVELVENLNQELMRGKGLSK